MIQSFLRVDALTLWALWLRDMRRFFRQPSRIVGALGQPLIFWFVIGSGMSPTFQMPGQNRTYMSYFYPGVVLMIVLFASIFASMSVIEDRHQGFLHAVLVSPASTIALVLGKSLGSVSVALVQVVLFLFLAPVAGFEFTHMNLGLLAFTLITASFGLCCLGFALAWFLDSTQAYHAIAMTLLLPMWILSGAMFPVPTSSAFFRWAFQLNPISYAVTNVRCALDARACEAVHVSSTTSSVIILLVFALGSLLLSAWVCRRS